MILLIRAYTDEDVSYLLFSASNSLFVLLACGCWIPIFLSLRKAGYQPVYWMAFFFFPSSLHSGATDYDG